jgi:hypothetical protein
MVRGQNGESNKQFAILSIPLYFSKDHSLLCFLPKACFAILSIPGLTFTNFLYLFFVFYIFTPVSLRFHHLMISSDELHSIYYRLRYIK